MTTTADNPAWKLILSPNRTSGRPVPVTGIIMHFTAAGSGLGSANYFSHETVSVKDKAGKTVTKKVSASAHVVIERDGTVYQCVPLGDRAWHAGVCTMYDGKPLEKGRNVNDVTIGVELAGWGQLSRDKDGTLRTYVGRKHEGEAHQAPDGTWWEAYPQAQIDSALAVCRFAMGKYHTITHVEGHQDIAPKRKVDPGPLFPWSAFRAALAGQETKVADPALTAKVVVPPVPEDHQDYADHEDREKHYDEDAEMCLV